MAERHHDLGGTPAGPIDRSEHQLEDWEILADAVNQRKRRNSVSPALWPGAAPVLTASGE
jgi:hypothetical protein